MKTLVISRSFPPHVSGSSTILGNLFRHFPRDNYVVLKERREPIDTASQIDCTLFSCDLRFRGIYFGGNLGDGYIQYLPIPFLTLKALKIIKQEKIDNIFSVYPSSAFFISSFFAHKIARKPLFVYMHDTWEEQTKHWQFKFNIIHRFIARIFEKMIFNSASKIFAISHALCDLYSKKHGIQVITLPHCIELPPNYSLNNAQVYEERKEPYKIVFTGSIYGVNLAPIRMLANVINSLLEVKVKLILCTPDVQYGLRLQDWGIYGENIEARFATRAEALSLQREADILFLPLAFELSNIELQTAFPTKTLEYLISGTPILVCAPTNYYISKCAREGEWGLVVDSLDYQALKEGILLLLKDYKLRRKLVHNARKAAIAHDANVISKKLQEYLRG